MIHPFGLLSELSDLLWAKIKLVMNVHEQTFQWISLFCFCWRYNARFEYDVRIFRKRFQGIDFFFFESDNYKYATAFVRDEVGRDFRKERQLKGKSFLCYQILQNLMIKIGNRYNGISWRNSWFCDTYRFSCTPNEFRWEHSIYSIYKTMG